MFHILIYHFSNDISNSTLFILLWDGFLLWFTLFPNLGLSVCFLINWFNSLRLSCLDFFISCYSCTFCSALWYILWPRKFSYSTVFLSSSLQTLISGFWVYSACSFGYCSFCLRGRLCYSSGIVFIMLSLQAD